VKFKRTLESSREDVGAFLKDYVSQQVALRKALEKTVDIPVAHVQVRAEIQVEGGLDGSGTGV